MDVPTTISAGNYIDVAIATWLHAKEQLSGSRRTRVLYERILNGFRVQLRGVGLDLDPKKNIVGEVTEEALDQAYAILATAAQGYAAQSLSDKKVSPGTFSNRIAVLSSFYEFASNRRFFKCDNPMKSIERPHAQLYRTATPIDAQEISRRMKQIDRSDKLGVRDYALLAIYLQTGRRLTEVVELKWSQVEVQEDRVIITFHCKGGKILRDQLPPPVSNALFEWLRIAYGESQLTPDTPLWISLKRQSKSGELTSRSVSNICEKRLGFSKVHTLRHTWAHMMEEHGAKVSEIQTRLGHESIATTSYYLSQLSQARNSHEMDIAQSFGLDA